MQKKEYPFNYKITFARLIKALSHCLYHYKGKMTLPRYSIVRSEDFDLCEIYFEVRQVICVIEKVVGQKVFTVESSEGKDFFLFIETHINSINNQVN